MPDYIGRFAPSPTGPLHLGSLYAALASFLDARHHHGHWLLRIEDIDPPREQAGATEAIIRSLEAHQLAWDGDILYQHNRDARYQEQLDSLARQGQVFYCTCSRKQLAAYTHGYPGTCRECQTPPNTPSAIRLRTDQEAQSFTDQLLGEQHQPELQTGCYNDFVIKRKDDLYAYQLAVVVDDIDQGVTHVVRGSDILDSTYKQLYLYRAFNAPIPHYLHLPVITHGDGQKLSKQNHAPAIDDAQPKANIRHALTLLNQKLPPQDYSLADTLSHAIEHWQSDQVRRQLALPITS